MDTSGKSGAPAVTTRTGLPQVWASTQKKVCRAIASPVVCACALTEAANVVGRQIDRGGSLKHQFAHQPPCRGGLSQPEMTVAEGG